MLVFFFPFLGVIFTSFWANCNLGFWKEFKKCNNWILFVYSNDATFCGCDVIECKKRIEMKLLYFLRHYVGFKEKKIKALKF